jgi:hypothetical protein
MQYFVSIENCQFFRWQIELLYESMRLFGLENNLVIGCANLEKKKLRFQNVFYHENYGRKNGYLPYNKTFALWTAIKNKLIKQPFSIIDPDMIMIRPLEYSENSYSQYCYFLEYENLRKIGCVFDLKKSEWSPGGVVYYFNNCDDNLLADTHKILFKMLGLYKNKLPEVANWQIEMIAFAYVLSKTSADIRFDLESNLIENKNSNFLHYCNGYQPFFNKRTHNNLRHFSVAEPLPFNSILSIPNKNKNIINFKKVTKSFLDNYSNDLCLI